MHLIYCIENVTALSYHVNVAIKLSIYIVADWGNSRIQIFDSQGSFLSFVNTLACPLYGPQGVAATGDGQVVVADTGNHCYKIYKYLQ